MSKIALVHWHPGEAEERAERLRRSTGHDVVALSEEGGAAFRRLKASPPDAVVIDLARLPSHGRHTAATVRQTAATRHLPLVFVRGDPSKVDRVRASFPDCEIVDWPRLRGALTRALKRRPASHAAPPAAGYSGTPLPKKLGLEPGSRLMLLDAPDDIDATLGELPDRVEVVRTARGRADVVVLFVARRAALAKRLPVALRSMDGGACLWVAWPKRGAGTESDLGREDVRAAGLKAGVVDTKVCAIDATWSGLQFRRRRR